MKVFAFAELGSSNCFKVMAMAVPSVHDHTNVTCDLQLLSFCTKTKVCTPFTNFIY